MACPEWERLGRDLGIEATDPLAARFVSGGAELDFPEGLDVGQLRAKYARTDAWVDVRGGNDPPPPPPLADSTWVWEPRYDVPPPPPPARGRGRPPRRPRAESPELMPKRLRVELRSSTVWGRGAPSTAVSDAGAGALAPVAGDGLDASSASHVTGAAADLGAAPPCDDDGDALMGGEGSVRGSAFGYMGGIGLPSYGGASSSHGIDQAQASGGLSTHGPTVFGGLRR